MLDNIFVRVALVLAFQSCNAHACNEPERFEALRAHEVVVVGEYHGTNEIPPFFSDLVCSLAETGSGAVLVGLELPTSFNALFQRAHTMSMDEVRQAVRAHAFWEQYSDGRSSQAMLTMLEGLLEAAASVRQIRLVALAGRDTDTDGATIFADAMKGSEVGRGVVLIGNAHARMLPMYEGHYPFSAQLKQTHGLEVLSLDVSASGGEVWVCLFTQGPSAPPQCGPQPVFVQYRGEGVHLSSCADCAYNGVYHLDALSISQAVAEGN